MHTPSDDTQQQQPHPKYYDALAGAIAGCISRVIVGPLDVIKIRFQVQLEPIANAAGVKAPSKYTGFVQAFTTIFKEEGVQVRVGVGPVCAGRWKTQWSSNQRRVRAPAPI